MKYYKISIHNMLVQYYKESKICFLEFENLFLSNPGISFFTFCSYHFQKYLYLLFKFASGQIQII